MAPRKTGPTESTKQAGAKYKGSPAPVATVEDAPYMHRPDHSFQGPPHAQQIHPKAPNGIHTNQTGSYPSEVSGAPRQSAYTSPHLQTGHPPHSQPQYGAVAQDAHYYPSHPSPHSATSTSGHYGPAESQEYMATAHMQQRPYQNIYHTPQSNSPASIASPQTHDQHGRTMYGQPPPPLTSPMYGYPQYSPMSQVHSSPYGHPGQPQHPQLTSQPYMHPTGPAPISHQQVPGHSSGMNSSPRMKLESSQQQQHAQQQQPARLPMSQSQTTPTIPSGPVKMEYNGRPDQQSHGGVNANSAPGPIPATTPLVVRQDNNGVQWIAFEYSRDRVKLEYTIRCDVESVNVEELTPEFKNENCVYPRACCPKDQYRGNRLNYETECNAVGWALADLNQCLRGKRGLIQRAVDSWRNSNQDVRLRSRRVRRQAKMSNRKGPTHSGPPGPMGGSSMPGSAGIPGANSGMPAPNARTPGTISMGAPQLHHHHAHPDGSDSRDDVSDYSGSHQSHRQAPPQQIPLPTDLRHSQMFHGYPNYPATANGEPSMAPPMHHAMDSLGRPVGTAAIASTDKSDDEDQKNALFGDLPEGKRRKFILVEDQQQNKRVRVKVMLDQVNMKEIPDSYRKGNSVFPRSYFATEMEETPDASRNRRFFADDDDDDAAAEGEPVVSRTLVPVPLPDGAEGDVSVPRISRSKHQKEETLNDLGYRMSWSQSRTFASRHLFLQRSLDAYRNKMRSTMITAGQEGSVSPHFETRIGKRRWEEREKIARRGTSPAPTSAS